MTTSTAVQCGSTTQHDRHPASELQDGVQIGTPPNECMLSRRLHVGEHVAAVVDGVVVEVVVDGVVVEVVVDGVAVEVEVVVVVDVVVLGVSALPQRVISWK